MKYFPENVMAAFLAVFFLLMLPASGIGAGDGVRVVKHRIGVLAKRGPEAALHKWQATADYLSAEIPGHRFEIMPLSFAEISEAVKGGKVEFVLANPVVFLNLSTDEGIRPLATLENLRDGKGYSVFGGVIFVRADSNIIHYRDLQGATFAAVSKNSLGGWLMAQRELESLHITPAGGMDGVVFTGTHDNVVFGVRDGKYDAGTVRTDTLERMQQEGKINIKDFRVLLQNVYYPIESFPFLRSTPLYPEWPFAAARSVPDRLNKEIAVALLRMPPESEAARRASISGWDVVRNYQPIHELEKQLRLGQYKKINYLNYKDVLEHYGLLLKFGALALVVLVLLLSYLLHLKRLLRADIRRRRKIEQILKTTNRNYYNEIKHYMDNNI